GRGPRRHRPVRMRALLPGLPAGDPGWQAGRGGDDDGDDRADRRGLIRRPIMSEGAGPATATAETLVLVGCGQMGSAMLRGWLAREAAVNFIVVEPAGLPASFAAAGNVAWHRAADELPDGMVPDAVVFAVKPQIIDAVLPAYRRWARPQ